MHLKKISSFYVKIICFILLVGLFYFNILVSSSKDFGKLPKIKFLNSESEVSQEIPDSVENKDKINCTQWIVITTISLPTDDIKYIHDSSFDWCIVVVADKKTPVNWSYKNVVFLSVEVQEQMAKRFKVVRLKKALYSNFHLLHAFYSRL